MVDQRLANRNWAPAEPNGAIPTWERVNTALLMDLRDELQKLNRLLSCPNFLAIPQKLDRIARNTIKPKRKKKS